MLNVDFKVGELVFILWTGFSNSSFWNKVAIYFDVFIYLIYYCLQNPNFVARKPPDMRGVFKKLAELRRDILSNQLTVQHQKDAKHSLVQLITEGNKNLNKFFEPSRRESSHGHRHPIIGVIPTVDGDVVDIDHCSIVNLHKIVSIYSR